MISFFGVWKVIFSEWVIIQSYAWKYSGSKQLTSQENQSAFDIKINTPAPRLQCYIENTKTEERKELPVNTL